ncbi:MalY/PatB family protein [Paenibacillus turpanensis]|uniref:MalY/PatB family protein n=1 Tax=Paenibacillus turpanensis TaxID=2689078 RepID=UPI00140C42B1|nr:MalY/PatB family protein [Paenibacillus turpanensis]
MSFSFDDHIDRRNTRSYKWDQSEKLFGDADLLPLWVADMDFKSPPQIEEALVKRAQEGIYGYQIRTNDIDEAIIGWFQRRHQWSIQPGWISDLPGVVTGLSLAVECFTEPGDRILVQTPVYYPFFDVIRMNGREIVRSPLLEQDGRFVMDYADVEQQFRQGVKLILLCNPHNPGGRVWTKEELSRLGELCLKYGVTVVSDEIHCDHTYPGHPHIPFASISEQLADITLTVLAPSKTFNIPGLHYAFMVTPNAQLKRKLDYRIKALSLHMTNFFGPVATEAAYQYGDEWLDALLVHLKGNIDYAIERLENELPEVKPMRPEGTYLLWVNCRGLGRSVPELKELMFKQAKVAFSEGSVFGEEGVGHLRINMACTRATLKEALDRFIGAAKSQAR